MIVIVVLFYPDQPQTIEWKRVSAFQKDTAVAERCNAVLLQSSHSLQFVGEYVTFIELKHPRLAESLPAEAQFVLCSHVPTERDDQQPGINRFAHAAKVEAERRSPFFFWLINKHGSAETTAFPPFLLTVKDLIPEILLTLVSYKL